MDFNECDGLIELKCFFEIPELVIDDLDAVVFDEELTVFNENFKSIGYIRTSVEKADDGLLTVDVRGETFDEYVPPHRHDCHSDDTSSNNSIMGFSTNATATALVDRHFNVYRERLAACEEQYNRRKENVRYLVKIGKSYYFDYKINGVQDNKTYKKFLSYDMVNVLTESLNVLVLKVIALKSYQGTFRARTFDLEGNIRPCTYRSTLESARYFRKQKVSLIKVERETLFANGTKATTSTILVAKSGRMVKLWWSDSNYSAATDPKYFLREEYLRDRPIPVEMLEECPRIRAIFSEKVRNNVAGQLKYFEKSPQIMEIINRFLNEVLLRKPENLVNFTLIFFSKLKQTVDKYQ